MVWARLSSVWPISTCCLTWSPTTSPNQNTVDSIQSSPQIKTIRAGKRRDAKSRLTSHLLGPLASSQPSLPPLPAPSKSSQAHMRTDPATPPWGTRERADLFSHTVQSIFPSIPFRFAVIQVCSVQLFSLKYQTLQREKKSLRSSDPSEKQSFPCEQNEGFVSKSAPAFHMQLPLFYLFKMWKSKDGCS